MNNPKVTFSIIVPAYNEEQCLPRVFQEITASMENVDCNYEVIIIDNASTDRTGEISKSFCQKDSRWKYIRFSRNFGAEISLAAGFTYAQGDAMITVYSDLQDPPDKIPEFISKWREGYDVVYGVRTKRPGDPAWRNFCVKIAYRLIRFFSECDLPLDAGDFRLITRRVRDVLVQMDERNRYIRGMIHWVGFKKCAIQYERRPRFAGESKGPFWSIVGFLITAITSFSVKPLRMFTIFGACVMAVTILATILQVFLWLFAQTVPGLTTTFILLLANLGVMSLGFGVLGEYVGRTYTETKRRPLWVVDRTINVEVK
jgi:glycosyltransferase involved in cell wall biosynthesis